MEFKHTKRQEANYRERRRMRHLNDYYQRLRTEVFSKFYDMKDRVLSKLQVVKFCLIYINELETRLMEINPAALHELQENFSKYIEYDDYTLSKLVPDGESVNCGTNPGPVPHCPYPPIEGYPCTHITSPLIVGNGKFEHDVEYHQRASIQHHSYPNFYDRPVNL